MKSPVRQAYAQARPVSGGVFDISRLRLSPPGINTLDKLAIITGTRSINEYVTDHPVIDEDLFMTSILIDGKMA